MQQGLITVKSASVLDAKNMLVEYLREAVSGKITVTLAAEAAINTEVPRNGILHPQVYKYCCMPCHLKI